MHHSRVPCALSAPSHSLPRQPQWGVWLADEDAGRATAAGKYTRTADYRLHSQSRAIDQDEKAPNPQRAKEGGLTTLLRAIYPFFTSTWGERRSSRCFDVLATVHPPVIIVYYKVGERETNTATPQLQSPHATANTPAYILFDDRRQGWGGEGGSATTSLPNLKRQTASQDISASRPPPSPANAVTSPDATLCVRYVCASVPPSSRRIIISSYRNRQARNNSSPLEVNSVPLPPPRTKPCPEGFVPPCHPRGRLYIQ